MGTRIRATLLIIFGLWWIMGMLTGFMEIFRIAYTEVKRTALFLYVGELIVMIPGFICINLGIRKLRWLRSKNN